MIVDAAACEAAAQDTGKPMQMSLVDNATVPKGCFWDNSDDAQFGVQGGIHFNAHTSGGAQLW